ARSFRHAAGARPFFARTFNLGKNQNQRAVANAGSMADAWVAVGRNVDQRADRLCFFASRLFDFPSDSLPTRLRRRASAWRAGLALQCVALSVAVAGVAGLR